MYVRRILAHICAITSIPVKVRNTVEYQGALCTARYGFEWDLNGGTLIFFEASSRYPSFARSEELYSRSREQKSVSYIQSIGV